MLIPTVIMGLLAIILVVLGYYGGEGQHIAGLKVALNLMITTLPLLFFAFVVAGMIQTLLPQDLISKWIGPESGMRGIILGSVAGGFSPGGPFVNLPIAIGLLRSGASVGTMVAFLTAWNLWAFARLPMEVGILGWRFTCIRLASTFFFPPVAGWIAQALFGGSKLISKM